MKDAADLVHALQDNLGWTELRLREDPGGTHDELALRLLNTCQRLAQLLQGAVAIARRDACVTSPQLQEISLLELTAAIQRELSSRVSVIVTSLTDQDPTVSVMHDSAITANVLGRILDAVPAGNTGDAVWTVNIGLRGIHAEITLTYRYASTVSPNLSSAQEAGTPVLLSDTLKICSALLARQGAALGYERDDEGHEEFTLIWPAQFGIASAPVAAGTSVAVADGAPAHTDAQEEKWSGTMAIQSDRFGSIEIEDKDIIRFPRGLIGFADEHSFVLVRTKSNAVGWLQSASNPSLALPVVSAHVLAPPYPDVDIESYTHTVGLGTRLDEIALIVVLNAQPGVPATVNLVAPIIVNVTTRTGAQIILDGTRFSTREMFVLPSVPENANQASSESAISAAE
jgi:flagellar assembly factor FliW